MRAEIVYESTMIWFCPSVKQINLFSNVFQKKKGLGFYFINIGSLEKQQIVSFKDQVILKLVSSLVIVCSDYSEENIIFSFSASGPVRGSCGFPGILSIVAWPTCYCYLSIKEADEFCGMLIFFFPPLVTCARSRCFVV